MCSWMNKNKKSKRLSENIEKVVAELKTVYKHTIHPLEEKYNFHEFHSPALNDADFDAKPMILLIGEYSTGKTTFIKYLLGDDYPGIPTTDKFVIVMHGEEEIDIPGHDLVLDTKMQFGPLNKYGNAFLNIFQASRSKNTVLDSVTIVDTPGILSGEKQTLDRGNKFGSIIEWFSEKVDRIILFFDANKQDISDEFQQVIENLKGHDDKLIIVLNKRDMVDIQSLWRVHSVLMWSLGNVLRTLVVPRLYVLPFRNDREDLFSDIQGLASNAALRKLNNLIKRASLAKMHAYIISSLKNRMDPPLGKLDSKRNLIDNLHEFFAMIQHQYSISPGDFPDIKCMQTHLENRDFTEFKKLDTKLLAKLDKALQEKLPRLMSCLPMDDKTCELESKVEIGAFPVYVEGPFIHGAGEGINKVKNHGIKLFFLTVVAVILLFVCGLNYMSI